jgi:hypothetical protein
MDIEIVNTKSVSRMIIYTPDQQIESVKEMMSDLEALLTKHGIRVGEKFERKAKGKA